MSTHVWSEQQSMLMEKLLEECESESLQHIESSKFRRRNISFFDDIDLLVRQGYIIDKNHQYSVCDVSLIQIRSSLAKAILQSADALWIAYRQEYLAEHDSVFLSTAANIAGLGMPEAQRALHYMLQGTWHRGYATPADRVYSSVMIGEDVLKFSSYTDWLIHQNKQHSDLLFLRVGGAVGFTTPILTSDMERQQPDQTPLPVWAGELPEAVRALLTETSQAKASGWNRLAAMGIRTLFDLVSTEALSADVRGFQKRLDEMLEEEHIASVQKQNLDALVNAGNAAAHRGFNPSSELIDTMWGIVLNTLESIYVLKPRAQKLKEQTPERPPQSNRER